jgi:hypothetical protein
MYDLFLATLHPSSFGGAKLLGRSVLCYGFVVHRYSVCVCVCGAHIYILCGSMVCVCVSMKFYISGSHNGESNGQKVKFRS